MNILSGSGSFVIGDDARGAGTEFRNPDRIGRQQDTMNSLVVIGRSNTADRSYEKGLDIDFKELKG